MGAALWELQVANNSAGTWPANATVTAYKASLIAKASAGTLIGFSGYNSLATAQFIQLHDSATLPADTAVPAFIMLVAGASPFYADWSPWGRPFTNGIVICNSTTGPAKTIGAANCWFDVQYA